MNYPKDWPRCPKCDDYAMDGHITCGRAECGEQRREGLDGRVPTTCIEHAYGSVQRLSFQIKVF